MIKRTRLEGLSYWSRFQPDRGIDFNGFHWRRPAGGTLIDPMDLGPVEREAVRELGGARWIVLTNFDHLRAAPAWKQALDAELWAPAGERERFGPHETLVDGWFERAADLPGDLREGLRVFPLRGGKSPVEVALYLEAPRALVFGDLVRSHVSGELTLLPDAKLADRAAVVESLRPLGVLAPEALLLGDGDCLFRGAGEPFRAFLDGLT